MNTVQKMIALQALSGSIVGAGVVYVLFPKFDTRLKRFGYAAISFLLSLLTAKAILTFLSTKFGLNLDIDDLGTLVITLCYHILIPPAFAFLTNKSGLTAHQHTDACSLHKDDNDHEDNKSH